MTGTIHSKIVNGKFFIGFCDISLLAILILLPLFALSGPSKPRLFHFCNSEPLVPCLFDAPIMLLHRISRPFGKSSINQIVPSQDHPDVDVNPPVTARPAQSRRHRHWYLMQQQGREFRTLPMAIPEVPLLVKISPLFPV
jgi:hypothetical protein